MAIINGTPGADALLDTADDDAIDAMAANDSITVHAGADTVLGGAGIDRLIVNYSALVQGVTMLALDEDEIGVYAAKLGTPFDTKVSFAGIENFTITTGLGNDEVTVGAGNNVIDLGAGADGLGAEMSGVTGAITVNLATNLFITPGGGSIAHVEYFAGFNTGSGNDTIVTRSGPFNDVIDTGAGDDSITVRSGFDSVEGGAGSDVLIVDYGALFTNVTSSIGGTAATGHSGSFTNFSTVTAGYSAIETFVVITGAGNDVVRTGDGADNIRTGAGDDIVRAGGGADHIISSAGAELFDGGTGFDYVHYDFTAAAVVADMLGTHPGTGEAAGDTFISVESLVGSRFGDGLHGDAQVNALYGQGGDDTLEGRGGADRLDGGAGFDIASYETAGEGVVANLATAAATAGDAAGDVFVSIEAVVGSAFNDTLRGAGANDILRGGNGNDQLTGGAGGDTLDGGLGTDYARYDFASAGVSASLADESLNAGEANSDDFVSIEGLIGSRFDDVLVGDSGSNDLAGLAGNDTLRGGLGGDVLQGLDGADRLDGGGGADRLFGGTGNDVFVLRARDANGDVLFDFAGNGGAAGDALRFEGYGAGTFTWVAGTNRWTINSFDGTVHDTIVLSNNASIDASDYAFIA